MNVAIAVSFDRSPHTHSSIPPIHMGHQWPRDHFMNTTLQSQCFLIFHMIGVIMEIDRLFLIVFFIGNTSFNNICGVYSSQPS